MKITSDFIQENIEENERLATEKAREIANEEQAVEKQPTVLGRIAVVYQDVGQGYAVLGEKDKARNAYAAAASFHQKCKNSLEEQSEAAKEYMKKDIPSVMKTALDCAIISQDTELITEIAAETLSLNDSYVETYRSEAEQAPYRLYNAKLRAAMISKDGQRDTLFEKFQTAIAGRDHLSAEDRAEFYENVIENDTEPVTGEILFRHTRYATEIENRVKEEGEAAIQYADLVHEEAIIYCLIANEYDISVTINSPYIPNVLVPGPETADHVVHVERDNPILVE